MIDAAARTKLGKLVDSLICSEQRRSRRVAKIVDANGVFKLVYVMLKKFPH
jgi:hypothetical protein